MTENQDHLHEKVAELKGRVDELSAQVKVHKKKGFIEILSSLSPLISGVLIASVATIATITYNERQIQLAQLNALDKYRVYLNSENPQEREFGYQAFVALGQEDFVIKLIGARNDSAGVRLLTSLPETASDKIIQSAESTADIIMAKATSPEQHKIPTPVSTADVTTVKEGWAYLGHYMASTKKWKTRYFNFEADALPDDLTRRRLTVDEKTGALNVRAGMPTLIGQFQEVIDVLKPGSEATVHEVQEWYSTGYMWAKITYGM